MNANKTTQQLYLKYSLHTKGCKTDTKGNRDADKPSIHANR